MDYFNFSFTKLKGSGLSKYFLIFFSIPLILLMILYPYDGMLINFVIGSGGALFTVSLYNIIEKHPAIRQYALRNMTNVPNQKKKKTNSRLSDKEEIYISKNEKMLYILPFELNDIVRSYVIHSCTLYTVFLTAMFIFGIISAVSAVENTRCIFGSIIFITNAFIIPSSTKRIKKMCINYHTLYAGILSVFITFFTFLYHIFFPDDIQKFPAVSVYTGIITSAVSIISAVKIFIFHKNFLNDSTEYFASDKTATKEK